MRPFGMPGPGGSLGKCAVCGGNFLAEILLGQSVNSIELHGVDQTLYLHYKCAPLLKNGMDWKDLPPASPLRAAFEKADLARSDKPIDTPPPS